jgi:hypothetical protein
VRVSIPESVITTEIAGGAVLMDRQSKGTARLDLTQYQIWQALASAGTVERAHKQLSAALGPVAPSLETIHQLTNLLADRGLLRTTRSSRIRRAAHAMRTKGAGHVLAIVARRLRRRVAAWTDGRFDRRFGTDTAGFIQVHKLGVTSPSGAYGFKFAPTPTPVVLQALREAVPDVTGYTFVDYGSGKGRPLLLASSWPFRRIIGVEYSAALHDIASRNIAIYRHAAQRCQDVQSLHVDAVDFELPDGDLMLFLFSPFDGPVLDRVIERIEFAVQQDPQRRLSIVLYSDEETVIGPLKALSVPMAWRQMPLTRGVPYEYRDTRLYLLNRILPDSRQPQPHST